MQKHITETKASLRNEPESACETNPSLATKRTRGCQRNEPEHVVYCNGAEMDAGGFHPPYERCAGGQVREPASSSEAKPRTRALPLIVNRNRRDRAKRCQVGATITHLQLAQHAFDGVTERELGESNKTANTHRRAMSP
jgi:hypothetical protein